MFQQVPQEPDVFVVKDQRLTRYFSTTLEIKEQPSAWKTRVPFPSDDNFTEILLFSSI